MKYNSISRTRAVNYSQLQSRSSGIMVGQIVLVLAILIATPILWIEAAPTDPADTYDLYQRDEDPASCRQNEYYTRSAAATNPTCQEPKLSLTIRIGMPGCVCKEGYVRDSEWVCIKKEDFFFEEPQIARPME